jgi:glc operon protein GlcG
LGVASASLQNCCAEKIMRHLILSCLSVVAAAWCAGAPAFAQAPPGTPPYGETINLTQARKAADAAMAEAGKNGWSMAIAVVGPSGDLVYFQKMDNTQYASVPIAQHKARTATIFRRPTKAFEENLGKGAEFTYQMTLDGMIGLQGGIPLITGGKIVGAIGCSGGAGPQDQQTCMAGVEALK